MSSRGREDHEGRRVGLEDFNLSSEFSFSVDPGRISKRTDDSKGAVVNFQCGFSVFPFAARLEQIIAIGAKAAR